MNLSRRIENCSIRIFLALVDVELETLVSEPDALTTRPSLCVLFLLNVIALDF